jgi:hypothetical protein
MLGLEMIGLLGAVLALLVGAMVEAQLQRGGLTVPRRERR